MSTDLTHGEWAAMRGPIAQADPRDLETLVSLLEMAAVLLTTIAGREFTRAQLFAEARACAGPDVELVEVDLDLVLSGCKFIDKRAGGRLALR